jgi:cell division protease FtsH
MLNNMLTFLHIIFFISLSIYYMFDYFQIMPSTHIVALNQLQNLDYYNVSDVSVYIYYNQVHMKSNINDTYIAYYSVRDDIDDFINIMNERNIPVYFTSNTTFINMLFTIVVLYLGGKAITYFLSGIYNSVLKLLGIQNDDTENDSIISITTGIEDSNKLFKIIKTVDTKFNDIIGMKKCKDELIQIVDMLKNRDKYIKSGAVVPRGVLMDGPPGTGKTLMAKAMAGESNMSFISTNASDFAEIYMGTGPKRVRELFNIARKNSPCIIFIDEIDSFLNRKKTTSDNSENNKTINRLLAEMDGFNQNENVFIMGATNDSDNIDDALIRSGRFDIKVHFEYPNKDDRAKLFKLYLQKIKLSSEISDNLDSFCNSISNRTFHITGADVKNIANVAVRSNIRKNIASGVNIEDVSKFGVSKKDIYEAVDEVALGKSNDDEKFNISDKYTIAFHELGHALVSYVLNDVENPERVSIISRGKTGGNTSISHDELKKLYTIDNIIGRISVLFGGQMAEFCLNNSYSSGASDDISKAFSVSKNIFTYFGTIPESIIIHMKHVLLNNNKLLHEIGTFKDDTFNDKDITNKESILLILNYARLIAFIIVHSNAKYIQDIYSTLILNEELEASDFDKYWSSVNKINIFDNILSYHHSDKKEINYDSDEDTDDEYILTSIYKSNSSVFNHIKSSCIDDVIETNSKDKDIIENVDIVENNDEITTKDIIDNNDEITTKDEISVEDKKNN